MSGKVLFVDDDIALAKTVEKILSDAGYQPILAHTAEDGLRLAFSEEPNLILLDIMIPQMGGWDVCRHIREVSTVPIIFLTALGNVENVVKGLNIGADDYIVKPFEHVELLARIKAHLRRTQVQGDQTPPNLTFGDDELSIDLPAHLVTVAGKEVDLTPREFDLLVVLASNAGKVVATADLVSRAWGMHDESAADNVKPYIHYLRKKIEKDPADPRWITTVRGVGYRFTDA